MAENNNELTEAEIKEYYDLNEKEKQIMQEAFEKGIKETINDFLDEKYGDTFISEDDVRARLYYHIVKKLDRADINARKLISSINLEMESSEKIKTMPGELDITAVTLSPKKEPKELVLDDIVCMEIKYSGSGWYRRPRNFSERLEGKIAVNDVIKELVVDSIKKDFKKLKDELDKYPNTKAYFLLFVTHNKNEEFEKNRVKYADLLLESLLDGKNITWVHVIRYSDFGKKCPFKSGIVKSNDKNIEEHFKQITA